MMILGHRGYSGSYPENTILSFKKALEYGADGIELDVHLSKDGKMVVCHDENLYRTYGKHRWIKDETLEDMKKLKSLGQRISTLEEVFHEIPKSVFINIELKTNVMSYPYLEEKVMKLVNDNVPERVLISSFNHSTLAHVREIDENIKLGMLFGEEHIKILKESMALSLEIDVFSYNIPSEVGGFEGFDEFINFANEHGVKMIFWGTNTIMDFGFAKAHKAYAVITNEVERAVNFFKGEKRIDV